MKRQTKKQQRAAQIEALKKRLRDELIGASDYGTDQDVLCAPGIAALLRWATRELGCADYHTIGLLDDNRKYVLYWWNVDEYKSLNDAAEFFYRQGWRA